MVEVSAAMKLCKDCKWIVLDQWHLAQGDTENALEFAKCGHANSKLVASEGYYCSTERCSPAPFSCTSEGRWFELKLAEPKPSRRPWFWLRFDLKLGR